MLSTTIFAALDPTTLFTVGVMMILVVVIRYALRPKRGQAPYQTLESRRLDSSHERENWEVKMHDTARDLMGELNTKIAIVEQLVRDAHAAAERLQKACEQAESLKRRTP